MQNLCLNKDDNFCPKISLDINDIKSKGGGGVRSFAELTGVYAGATKKNLLTNNRSSCFYSYTGYTLSNYNYDCGSYKIFADGESVFGTSSDVATAYSKVGDPLRLLHLQGDVPDMQRNENSIVFSRALIGICFDKMKDSNILLRLGLNNFYSRDMDYGSRGGWYTENYRCYLANGNDQNVENIPIVVDGTGAQIVYNTKNLRCYFDIINGLVWPSRSAPPSYDSNLEQNINSNGFLDLKNKNLFDLGFTYKNEDLLCPLICNIHCQKYISRNRIEPLFPSTTALASKNITNNFIKSSSLDSYSINGVTNIKDIQVSGAFSCVPTENYSSQNGRLLMWSLGCISVCKSLKCFPKILGKQVSYGLNLSTPLYVSKSNTDNRTDGTPYVCEANIFLQMCKFNIPIFIDLIDMPKYNEDYDEISGKGIICGCRPYIIYDTPANRFWRNRIDCPVEGGLA